MKNIALLFLLIGLTTSVFSQELIKQKFYKKEKGKSIPKLEIFRNSDGTFLIKEYNSDGTPKMIANSKNKNLYKLDGDVKYYSEKGILKYEGTYKDKFICCEWKLYDENGKLERILDYNFDMDTMQVSETENLKKTICDEEPKFQGGDPGSFVKYIADNLFYPPQAAKNMISGKLWVRFDIDEKGNLVNVKLLRDLDPSLDKEALRVILSSPKWKPAMKDGKPILLTYSMPIVFNLK
ncbi:TonB family protein [Ancylomarina salipaludis]|uniref:TonB family protein n=1 Tax=Ancylomarina salipaludis TaxID=2501299 RepID=A0A4Q1JHR9_9BACT|nr:energy transducer TonB [Ancylomarina salipaludis]RXQ87403.1 TonB family protein [Ancylomarina salipaludis]